MFAWKVSHLILYCLIHSEWNTFALNMLLQMQMTGPLWWVSVNVGNGHQIYCSIRYNLFMLQTFCLNIISDIDILIA